MLQRTSTPPTGPKASRGPRHSSTTRTPARGGIQKRRAGSLRVDQDGDVDMDTIVSSGRGRGGRGRGSQSSQTHNISSRDSIRVKPGRNGLNPSAMQKAIIRGMSSGDAIVRGPKAGLRAAGVLDEAIGRGRGRDRRDGLDQIVVTGLKQSKAASNPDGGIKALVEFLERKATAPNASASEVVRIRKSRHEGDSVIISVKPEDTLKITRLDSYTFAGASLAVQLRASISGHQGNLVEQETSEATVQLKDKMTAMLNRRYNSELKLLDLSSLGSDPELVSLGMFSSNARESKFFPALMKVCDLVFTSPQQKREAVVSVTLANNTLTSVASVTTLSQTFPEIKNLDLSNNQLKDLGAMEAWRWKFRDLDHLILSGNPLETDVPTYQADIVKWYPKLRKLNATQVRSDEDIKAGAKGKLPMHILAPSFRDEASIGETFIKHFFPAYDTDRAAVAHGYYDSQSAFSLSVNTSAPRAQDAMNTKSIPWDAYIKKSRNLTKITNLPARMSRILTGLESIRDVWLTLPSTRHPDLLTEPHKWCIECHSVPGLPDPTGQSPSGVGGLIVMVHGEFSEVDGTSNNITTLRSFDRTFVLGPGGGIGGVRVINDVLVLRAYGGSDAWKPDVDPTLIPQPLVPLGPEGFAVAQPGKSDEQLQKELLALELSRTTGMTLEYSGLCLEQSAWDLEGAAQMFEQAKTNLPPDAWLSV